MTEPGWVDDGAAAERTSAAWTRTALSWGGAGLGIFRYFSTDHLLWGLAIGGPMVFAGAAMLGAASHRYVNARRWSRGEPMASKRLVPMVAAICMVASWATVVAEVARIFVDQ